MAEASVRTCRSRSLYGSCGRTGKHAGPHAVPIGGDVWFGYLPGGARLGYGRFNGDEFQPLAATSPWLPTPAEES